MPTLFVKPHSPGFLPLSLRSLFLAPDLVFRIFSTPSNLEFGVSVVGPCALSPWEVSPTPLFQPPSSLCLLSDLYLQPRYAQSRPHPPPLGSSSLLAHTAKPSPACGKPLPIPPPSNSGARTLQYLADLGNIVVLEVVFQRGAGVAQGGHGKGLH